MNKLFEYATYIVQKDENTFKNFGIEFYYFHLLLTLNLLWYNCITDELMKYFIVIYMSITIVILFGIILLHTNLR